MNKKEIETKDENIIKFVIENGFIHLLDQKTLNDRLKVYNKSILYKYTTVQSIIIDNKTFIIEGYNLDYDRVAPYVVFLQGKFKLSNLYKIIKFSFIGIGIIFITLIILIINNMGNKGYLNKQIIKNTELLSGFINQNNTDEAVNGPLILNDVNYLTGKENENAK